VTQPDPLACAGLSFAATAALLLWGVWNPADGVPHVPLVAPSLAGSGSEMSVGNERNEVLDPGCDDPRIASRHLHPELRVLGRDPNVIC
jgi:hypothetical protein